MDYKHHPRWVRRTTASKRGTKGGFACCCHFCLLEGNGPKCMEMLLHNKGGFVNHHHLKLGCPAPLARNEFKLDQRILPIRCGTTLCSHLYNPRSTWHLRTPSDEKKPLPPGTGDRGFVVSTIYGEEHRQCSFDRRNLMNKSVILTFHGANKR